MRIYGLECVTCDKRETVSEADVVKKRLSGDATQRLRAFIEAHPNGGRAARGKGGLRRHAAKPCTVRTFEIDDERVGWGSNDPLCNPITAFWYGDAEALEWSRRIPHSANRARCTFQTEPGMRICGAPTQGGSYCGEHGAPAAPVEVLSGNELVELLDDARAGRRGSEDAPRVYPLFLGNQPDDPRFNLGLLDSVREALTARGYPDLKAGDFLELQSALFGFLYGKGRPE